MERRSRSDLLEGGFGPTCEYPTNHQELSDELERRVFLGVRLICFPH
jgi:hypothetical protein